MHERPKDNASGEQDAELWRRALVAFEQIDALPPDRVYSRLADLAAEDPRLAHRVRDLLSADARDGLTLEQPALGDALPASAGTVTLEAGTMLGPYRLLQRLGEGGMGEVWEADQTGPVRRRVAIKVIRQGLGGHEVIERFHHERQAMALMSHPHIAAVFDADSTADGRPYFVMERVHGQPITTYCDQRRLDLAARLQLVRQVCAAVQHAHHKGLVHRDLKASNILVSGGAAPDATGDRPEPCPKVIDFGIAKAVSGPLAERARRTEEGRLLGTLEAMSPEQAAGDDVDTRSDVYSLGVLLYELLCGERPLELESLPILDGLTAIGTREPPPPSVRLARSRRAASTARARRLSPAALERMLRGDLDWIVLRSLDKEREQRYATPADLASDIGRHLADEPVIAGPPSTLYRLRKFVRRHRLSVVASGAVVLALVAGLAVAAAGWDRAEREADAARRAAELLADSFAVFDPIAPRGHITGPTPDDVLARGVERTRSALAEQPRLRARLLATLGRVYRNRGDYGEAGPLLEESLALRLAEFGRSHPEVATSHRELGWFAFSQGDRAKALEHFRLAVAAADASDRVADLDRALYLADYALVLWKMGRAQEAEAPVERAVALAQTVAGPSPSAAQAGARLTLSSCLYVRGLVATERGAWRLAQESLDRSLGLRTAALGVDHPQVAWVLVDLGWLDRLRGSTESAESHLAKAVAIFERRLGPDHPDTAVALNALGYALLDLGDLERSRATFARALSIRRAALDAGHPDLMASVEGLAWVDLAAGDLRTVRARGHEILETRRRLYGELNPEVGYALDLLAREAGASGDVPRARDLADQSLAVLRATLGQDHPRVASIARALAAAGRHDAPSLGDDQNR
ncbi:MAG: serine/threonine-protein kinase [Acidobacteriota bacterium]